MDLIRVVSREDTVIVTENKFVVNKIFPVAIRSTSLKENFLILYKAEQDFDESTIFIQQVVHTNSPFEFDLMNNHPLNLSVISSDPKLIEKYKDITKELAGADNLYTCNFDMEEDKDHPMYFTCKGIKSIDEKHSAIVNLFITRENFIRIHLYLQSIKNPTKGTREKIFFDKRFHNIKFEIIEKIKYDATCKKVINNTQVNFNHYTMNCGPSEFKMNLITPIDKDHLLVPLSNPLAESLYEAFYKNDSFIFDMIVMEEYIILIWDKISSINGAIMDTVALKIPMKLADKTNFVDYNKNIYVVEGEK